MRLSTFRRLDSVERRLRQLERSDGDSGDTEPPPVAPDLAYTHVQSTSAATWTINHTLSFQPNVSVVDSSGAQVEGSVDYVDSDTLTIAFSAAFSGTAYLS